ncbi:MAG TPA: DUF5680 domain-containing protein [bacterium]|jgi:hypothetical protein|nr:MAG: hypothetical protein BWX82_00586 [Parcubacteria group bacterium ADurb.Bin115]HNU81749.1 DUF5680 domain-containing protein [bacterium]HQC46277.1 DUF5680 domain-containing protein [Candidatus Paceibacterota bacterium]HPW05691.1 DUF5680 domain-containing protein [bacterium]HQM18892.1 DUF5680 domain-containing protein [Candidatus Paceibacterota bacterium]
MKDFKRFLIKAKKNTYALSGERGESVLADGAKELNYKSENFYYRDRYYGSDPFVGEEVVFLNNKPFWVMNYSGRCLETIISKSEIYSFLKKCLKKVNANNPFRGPSEYQSGEYIYKNKTKGDIDNFYGEELICYKNKKIYELKYHGGLVE